MYATYIECNIHECTCNLLCYVRMYCSCTGDSNPALPANTSVFGIGVDFVIIQWTIQRLLFTPETYYVEYSELTDDEEIPTDAEITSVQYPTVNTNFSAVNMEYRFVVNGLNPDSAYGFRLVAVNSIGESETPASLYFQTRHEGSTMHR